MLPRAEQGEQLRQELRNISDSDTRREIQCELARILGSDQFNGSSRSSRFLQHVMAKALAGEFDALKERVLGIEILGRDPMFDTNHDATVRVTANDVRRRLKQYYQASPQARVRIALPSGMYIPQIEMAPPGTAPVIASEPATLPAPAAGARPRGHYVALCIAGFLLVVLPWCLLWWRMRDPAASPARNVLPWSALFKPGHKVEVVVADANLIVNKVRSHQDVPIGVYSSHNFAYAPDLPGMFGSFLNTTPLTTASDARIASRIAELAVHAGSGIQLKYCNRVDVTDLKGPEPMIFLGSSTSNPWVALFSNQLNFQIVHRFDTDTDVCINRQPKPGELPVYVPTPRSATLSVGYAVITLTPNLSGQAPVLLIAGTTTEATEAAGDFVLNFDRLSGALKRIGIGRAGPPRRLEVLIKTSFVSTASVTSDVISFRTQ